MVDYAKKTVAELTEILKSRNLSHAGKKADLVARLNEADKEVEEPGESSSTSRCDAQNARHCPRCVPMHESHNVQNIPSP